MLEHDTPRRIPPARSITNKVTYGCEATAFLLKLPPEVFPPLSEVEHLYLGSRPRPDPLEIDWRHHAWIQDRRRVRLALVAAKASSAQQDRFAACGSGCVVEYHRDSKDLRVRGFFCGNRFCRACGQSRTAKARSALQAWCEEATCYMITLTLKHRVESMATMLNRLVKNFAKLRRSAWWRRYVTGGAWIVEIKRGKGSARWHVHIHALARAPKLSQVILRRRWKKITRDSFQVKCRRVTDARKGASYVAKYLTKGIENRVLRNPDDLHECIVGLRGRRLIATFGRDRPRALDVERPDPAGWKFIGRLSEIIRQANSGDLWATGIILALRPPRPEAEGPSFDPAVENRWFGPDGRDGRPRASPY